jgi:hypothetical protein
LDAIFSRQGLPEVLKSDNGPTFNGAEFEPYAKHCGFTHRKITPYWPGHLEEKLEASDQLVSPQLQGNPPFHY